MEITADSPLPQLRDELQFMEAAVDGNGQSGFLIFDPVQHKYFRIGLIAARAFGVWVELFETSDAAGGTGADCTAGGGGRPTEAAGRFIEA